jgi:hypothetical protein
MRRQARRESSRAWIASGATVSIKTYARRYSVDRYTTYEDLTAIGFPLPDSARRWAHRPPPQPRPPRSASPRALLDDDWIMIDGRPYFVAGYLPGMDVPAAGHSPGARPPVGGPDRGHPGGHADPDA